MPDRIVKLKVCLGRSGTGAPWHFLNFFPLPQGHGSFLPTFEDKNDYSIEGTNSIRRTPRRYFARPVNGMYIIFLHHARIPLGRPTVTRTFRGRKGVFAALRRSSTKERPASGLCLGGDRRGGPTARSGDGVDLVLRRAPSDRHACTTTGTVIERVFK